MDSDAREVADEGSRAAVVRVRLDLAYDGSGFSGWAKQPRCRTVEGELAAALATVIRIPDLRIVVAGRTDAGVHAVGQVCHVDLPRDAWIALPGRSTHGPATALLHRLAGVLPADIAVRGAAQAPSGFDARFSALARHYRYRIVDDPAALDPLQRHRIVPWRRALDHTRMSEAAAALLGLHDFAAFCKPRDGATTIRTLMDYRWSRQDGVLVGEVVADAFCHSMVRALVGAVIPVGEGRADPHFPVEVLRGAVRDPRVRVMPAHGLTLERVDYPADEELLARAIAARARRELLAPDS